MTLQNVLPIPQGQAANAFTTTAGAFGPYLPDLQKQGTDLENEASLAALSAIPPLSGDDLQALRSQVNTAQEYAQSVAGYVNLDPNQKSAIDSLSHGDYSGALSKAVLIGGQDLGVPPGVTSDLMSAGKSIMSGNVLGAVSPCIGAVMTGLVAAGVVSGGMGAAAAAMVAGGVGLSEAGAALFRKTSATGCPGASWTLGDFCFSGPVPFGPNDSTWQTLGDFMHGKNSSLSGSALGAKASSVWKQLAYEFPSKLGGYENNAGTLDGLVWSALNEVTWLEKGQPPSMSPGGPAPGLFGAIGGFAGNIAAAAQRVIAGTWAMPCTTPLAKDSRFDGFRLAFARLYLSNVEKALNGHPLMTTSQMLHQAAYAWNALHSGPPVTFAAPHYFYQPNPDPAYTTLYLPNGALAWSLIEYVMSGKPDQIAGKPNQPTPIYPWAPLTLYTPTSVSTGQAAIDKTIASLVKQNAPIIQRVNAYAAAQRKASRWTPTLVAGGAGAILVGGYALWERLNRR